MKLACRSRINSCLILTFCVVSVIGAVKSQSTKPAFIRFLRRYQDDKFQSASQCFSYMQECNPDKNECCGDLKCLNYLQGYCLYPLENCWCTTGRMYNTDNA